MGRAVPALGVPAAVVIGLLAPLLGYWSLAVLAPFALVILVLRPQYGAMSLVVLAPANDLISGVLASNHALIFGAAKDVVLLASTVGALVSSHAHRRTVPVGVVVLLIQVGALAGALNSESLVQAAYGWRNNFQPMLAFVLVVLCMRTLESLRMLRLLAWVAQFWSLVALFTWLKRESWLYHVGIFPYEAGAFPHQFFTTGNDIPRAFSPFGAPNDLGTASAIAVAVIATHPNLSLRRKVLMSVLPVTACIISRSRSAMLGLIFAAVLTAGIALRRRFAGGFWFASSISVVAGTASLFIVVTSSYAREPSMRGHVTSFAAGYTYLTDYPLGVGLGEIGPRASRYVSEPIHVESFLLLVGLEAGVVVAALYVLFHGLIILRTRFHLMVVAVVTSASVNQIVLPSMQDGSLAYLYWLTLGAAVVLANYPRETQTVSKKERSDSQEAHV